MPRGKIAGHRGLSISAGAALIVAFVAGLTSCAPEPITGWDPPQRALSESVRFATTDQELDRVDLDSAPVDHNLQTDSVSSGVDTEKLGLFEGRVRNDSASFAARYVYVPGATAFNDRVTSLLREAIASTGMPYVPEVYPVEAGLSDRGCVAGSLAWPAVDLLTRTETGVPGGSGVAVTCEVVGAFGDILMVHFRTVDAAAGAALTDTVVRLTLNVVTGEVSEGVPEWSPDAPAELWEAVAELLRQRAGALSTAPLAAPDPEQLNLATLALQSSARVAGGGLHVSLPAGFTSPELQNLGLEPTAAPVDVIVDAPTALGWSNSFEETMQHAVSQTFVGISHPAAGVPVDCTLVPCIALTYDDGPSDYTPGLLDTLAARQASATFYMMGGHAATQADVIARTVREGNEIGSHTMTHATLTAIPPAEARAQVRDAAEALSAASGVPVTTYRPPYGAIDAAAQAAIDMPAVLWTIDTNDWRQPGQDALFERAVLPALPGQIILFHDTHADTVNAAGAIIDGLRNRGFEPATVSELFGGSVPNQIIRAGGAS